MNLTLKAPNGRGCGFRDEENPYVCCGLSPYGEPIEKFIVDPAILWTAAINRGTTIVPRDPDDSDSINDLIVFVGANPGKGGTGYQRYWDFIEETRLFGVSRKVQKNFPFEKLTPNESRMLFVHRKVIPDFSFISSQGKPTPNCHIHDLDKVPMKEETLPGWHSDVWNSPCSFAAQELGFLWPDAIVYKDAGYFDVEMSSFRYTFLMPNYVDMEANHVWQPAIFMWLPLTHVEFCRKVDDDAREKANSAGFETAVLDY